MPITELKPGITADMTLDAVIEQSFDSSPDTSYQTELICDWFLTHHVNQREPDEIIPNLHNQPHIKRWYLVRRHEPMAGFDPEALRPLNDPRLGEPENVYIHRFLESDEDRALHDHPWSWISHILWGSYLEHTPADPKTPNGVTVATRRRAGEATIRLDGSWPHRIELEANQPLTLFITGDKKRNWGFWCPQGWRHHEEFAVYGCD